MGGRGCWEGGERRGLAGGLGADWVVHFSSAYGAPYENMSNVWEWGGAFTDFQGLPRFVCLPGFFFSHFCTVGYIKCTVQ